MQKLRKSIRKERAIFCAHLSLLVFVSEPCFLLRCSADQRIRAKGKGRGRTEKKQQRRHHKIHQLIYFGYQGNLKTVAEKEDRERLGINHS